MDDEDFQRPFRFIVTGKYLAVHYDGSKFEICRDHHGRGSLFYIADDGETIIHNRSYIAVLAAHPVYDDDVFYISQGQNFLTQDGQWTERIDDAVEVQIEPMGDYGDAEPPLPPPISNPIMDVGNPISADGIDLYLPDKWFSLYPVTGDSLWLGDASEFENRLYFGGNPYSVGLSFQLSKNQGKTRILSQDDKYLTVMMDAEIAENLSEDCKQHTRLSRCSRCMRCYTIGFSPEPQECLSLVPKGLSSMFAFYDGLCYYQFNALKGSYAELMRVENIDDASCFQFVG